MTSKININPEQITLINADGLKSYSNKFMASLVGLSSTKCRSIGPRSTRDDVTHFSMNFYEVDVWGKYANVDKLCNAVNEHGTAMLQLQLAIVQLDR